MINRLAQAADVPAMAGLLGLLFSGEREFRAVLVPCYQTADDEAAVAKRRNEGQEPSASLPPPTREKRIPPQTTRALEPQPSVRPDLNTSGRAGEPFSPLAPEAETTLRQIEKEIATRRTEVAYIVTPHGGVLHKIAGTS